MTEFQKRLLAGPATLALALCATGPSAQTAAQTERLDDLFVELAQPDNDDAQRIEAEIARIWSQSGSPAMDLLLQRASDALEAEDYATAIDHLSALTDHAPEFAEGWNARATAFFLMDEYALSIADIERTLALNPRHFGALEGLAAILEAIGEPELALRALRDVIAINPNRKSAQEGIDRLERETGAAEL